MGERLSRIKDNAKFQIGKTRAKKQIKEWRVNGLSSDQRVNFCLYSQQTQDKVALAIKLQQGGDSKAYDRVIKSFSIPEREVALRYIYKIDD